MSIPLLVAIGALLVGPGLFGLVLRLQRGEPLDTILRPAGLAAVWVLVLVVFFFILIGGDLVVPLVGFACGVGAILLALGWDELLDRLCPVFWSCVKRETYTHFSTTIPYFVLLLFVLLCGFFFWANLKFSQMITLRYAFDSVSSIGFFLFPLLTMGLFARERSEGTIEVLMTAPISATAVTVAKYLGVMAFYLVMLLPTFIFYLLLKEIGVEIGKPEPGPVASAFLGMVLIGSFFLSLGLFASSITRSQILAALLTWVMIVLFILSRGIADLLGLAGTDAGSVLEYLDPIRVHLDPFLRGLVDPKNVVFFLSFTVFFLFLSVRLIDARKWR